MPRSKVRRRGNPHKDPMNAEINRLSKLGGLAADIAADPSALKAKRKKSYKAMRKAEIDMGLHRKVYRPHRLSRPTSK